jgi:hypothetical protein
MVGDSSLIKVDSEAAKALIEKIAEGIGGHFKPFQIKRVAKAEAEAEIIRAKAQIEIDELQRRAAARFIAEEAKKQDNIENITRKAIPLLRESATPKKMENDWITNFFDKCRIISDDEMQVLWAKVLAGEANSPGNFSKRTVNCLAYLDKRDAESFTSLCRFAWDIGFPSPIIFNSEAEIYVKNGVNFNILKHLEDIELINIESVFMFKLKKQPQRIIIEYYGSPLKILFNKPDGNEFPIGHAVFTKTGAELAGICGAEPIDGLVDYATEQWRKEGISVSSTIKKNSG